MLRLRICVTARRREGAHAPPGRLQESHAQGGNAPVRDLKFAHLTTNDGLTQDNIVATLQDNRGFMWFATGGGLNRYDGNAFVVRTDVQFHSWLGRAYFLPVSLGHPLIVKSMLRSAARA